MAQSDFEQLMWDRGLTRTEGELLPAPTMPITMAFRQPAAMGRRVVGEATVELQLNRVVSSRSGGWAGVARIRHPSITGEGMLRPRVIWGTLKALSTGPKIATFFLTLFALVGVWVVMLPGMFLVWLMRRGLLAKLGVTPFPGLTVPELASRYQVWGWNHERARLALTPVLQASLAKTKWYGSVEVKPGEILLETPVGYTRRDLFSAFIDSVLACAAILR